MIYVGNKLSLLCSKRNSMLSVLCLRIMVHRTMYSDDEDSQEDRCVNYKQKYRELKKNLRYLIYENECFQDELRKAQHNFVSISRDKSFLLDRILKYEKPQGPSSDSEATESSDEEEETKIASSHVFSQKKKIAKRKRSEADVHNGGSMAPSSDAAHASINPKQLPLKSISSKPVLSGKGNPQMMKKPKKTPTARKPGSKKERDVSKMVEERNLVNSQLARNYDMHKVHIEDKEQVEMTEQELPNDVHGVEFEFSPMGGVEGHMTREEVERHLESRRFSPELNTTATVPAELFSHEADPESDFEEGEMCEFIQLEEDSISANMILE